MRKSSTRTLLALVCIGGFCWGCGGQSSVETASNDDGGGEPVAAANGPTIPDSMMPAIPGAGASPTGQQPPVPNYPAVQPAPSTPPAFDPNLPPGTGQRVRAEAGVGKRGQATKDVEGVGAMIVQPARTLFAVEQRAVFEIQIPKALQLFEATEGRKPRSHDEYMSKIIQANQIKLPELPAGQTYVYDPQLGELMVQK